MTRPYRFFAVLLLLACGCQAPGSLSSDERKQIDALFEEWDRPESPGCALAIIRDGRIAYQRGYGIANLEHDVPITPQTVFRIASTSKQFTAACVALLARDGRLSWDDPISVHLPEIRRVAAPVTIGHLLHHTSGIRDYIELMELAGKSEEEYYTANEAYDLLCRQDALNFPVGSHYSYSNSNYFLLSLIVEKASGMTLGQYAQQSIFGPLGMQRTHYHDDHNRIVRHRADGYARVVDAGYRICMTPLDITGDGAVFTTVQDLYLWDQNFYRPRVGDKDIVEQMLRPGTLNDGRRLDYAAGLLVNTHRGLPMISHSGSFVGFRSQLIRFPEQRLSVACLCNLAEIDPEELSFAVADILLADEYPGPAPDMELPFITLPADSLGPLTGPYLDVVSGGALTVAAQDGHLVIRRSGYDTPMLPVSPTEFAAWTSRQPTARFTRDEPKGYCTMVLNWRGAEPHTYRQLPDDLPDPGKLNEYAGRYRSAELQVDYNISVGDGFLIAKVDGHDEMTLEPIARDLFTADYATIKFRRHPLGDVHGFAASTPGAWEIWFGRTP
jgi:CubicO group peptidase (beta-lactamase class C family)